MDSDVVVYGFNYIGADMTEEQVYEKFKVYFPYLERNVFKWKKVGTYAIELLLTWEIALIFTYESEEMWRLETKESYIVNRMKGG